MQGQSFPIAGAPAETQRRQTARAVQHRLGDSHRNAPSAQNASLGARQFRPQRRYCLAYIWALARKGLTKRGWPSDRRPSADRSGPFAQQIERNQASGQGILDIKRSLRPVRLRRALVLVKRGCETEVFLRLGCIYRYEPRE